MKGKNGLLSSKAYCITEYLRRIFPMPCAVFVFAHLELVDAIVDRGRRRRPRVRYVDSVMAQCKITNCWNRMMSGPLYGYWLSCA